MTSAVHEQLISQVVERAEHHNHDSHNHVHSSLHSLDWQQHWKQLHLTAWFILLQHIFHQRGHTSIVATNHLELDLYKV